MTISQPPKGKERKNKQCWQFTTKWPFLFFPSLVGCPFFSFLIFFIGGGGVNCLISALPMKMASYQLNGRKETIKEEKKMCRKRISDSKSCLMQLGEPLTSLHLHCKWSKFYNQRVYIYIVEISSDKTHNSS